MANPDSAIIDYAPGYGPDGPKPYSKPAVLVRHDQPVSVLPPLYYTQEQPIVMAGYQAPPQGQTFQFTPMQLLIGGLLLYLLLRG